MGKQGFLLVLAAIVAGIILDRLLQRVISPPVALAPGPPSGNPGTKSPDATPDSIPGDGSQTAPAGYPVKGNERSGIYHVPGGSAYDRTIASTYFRSEEVAERAGLRHARA
jgi:hypothetical protein